MALLTIGFVTKHLYSHMLTKFNWSIMSAPAVTVKTPWDDTSSSRWRLRVWLNIFPSISVIQQGGLRKSSLPLAIVWQEEWASGLFFFTYPQFITEAENGVQVKCDITVDSKKIVHYSCSWHRTPNANILSMKWCFMSNTRMFSGPVPHILGIYMTW